MYILPKLSKLSHLPRYMQVIFHDVCIAWLFLNYRPWVTVSYAPVVSLFPLPNRR